MILFEVSKWKDIYWEGQIEGLDKLPIDDFFVKFNIFVQW